MDIRSGDIYIDDTNMAEAEFEKAMKELNIEMEDRVRRLSEHQEELGQLQKRLIDIETTELEPLVGLSKNARKNKYRNKPCVCGSGKKFKKCCWEKIAHENK